jgi:hypothetical protein
MKRIKPSILRVLRTAVQGHYDEIATEAKTTKGFVSHVLLGRRYSETVINKAIEVKERLAREKADLEARILSKEVAA